MGEPSGPDNEGDFDSRLARARDRERAPGERSADSSPRGGMGLAYRIATEMVAAVAVSVLIGIAIDRWLETRPWFLIAFTVMGFAAGMLNVFRLSRGHGYAAGYRSQDETKSDDKA